MKRWITTAEREALGSRPGTTGAFGWVHPKTGLHFRSDKSRHADQAREMGFDADTHTEANAKAVEAGYTRWYVAPTEIGVEFNKDCPLAPLRAKALLAYHAQNQQGRILLADTGKDYYHGTSLQAAHAFIDRVSTKLKKGRRRETDYARMKRELGESAHEDDHIVNAMHIDESHEPQQRGWITPNGDFHGVGIGSHYDWVKENPHFVNSFGDTHVHQRAKSPMDDEDDIADQTHTSMIRSGWIRKADKDSYECAAGDEDRAVEHAALNHKGVRMIQLDVHHPSGDVESKHVMNPYANPHESRADIMIRRALNEARERGKYAYHVTKRENLPAIARDGLKPNRGRLWHRAVHIGPDTVSRGRPLGQEYFERHDLVHLRYPWPGDSKRHNLGLDRGPMEYYSTEAVPPESIEHHVDGVWRPIVRMKRELGESYEPGHVAWISPTGKIHPVGDTDTHRSWIENNAHHIEPEHIGGVDVTGSRCKSSADWDAHEDRLSEVMSRMIAGGWIRKAYKDSYDVGSQAQFGRVPAHVRQHHPDVERVNVIWPKDPAQTIRGDSLGDFHSTRLNARSFGGSESCADQLIRTALNEGESSDEPQIDWHLKFPERAYISWFKVPKHQRGQGVGRAAYEKWEKNLPASVTHVELHAADSGNGPSDGFWQKMGFTHRYDYEDPPHPSSREYEHSQLMHKGIRGHKTPETEFISADEMQESRLHEGATETGWITPNGEFHGLDDFDGLHSHWVRDNAAYVNSFGKQHVSDAAHLSHDRDSDAVKATFASMVKHGWIRKADMESYECRAQDVPRAMKHAAEHHKAKVLHFDVHHPDGRIESRRNVMNRFVESRADTLIRMALNEAEVVHGTDVGGLRSILRSGVIKAGNKYNNRYATVSLSDPDHLFSDGGDVRLHFDSHELSRDGKRLYPVSYGEHGNPYVDDEPLLSPDPENRSRSGHLYEPPAYRSEREHRHLGDLHFDGKHVKAISYAVAGRDIDHDALRQAAQLAREHGKRFHVVVDNHDTAREIRRTHQQVPVVVRSPRSVWGESRADTMLRRALDEGRKYKEVEFDCENPSFPGSPTPEAIDALHNTLRTIPGLHLYRQDFGAHRSMAAIIKRDAPPGTMRKVHAAAKRHGVGVDMINDVDDGYVDRVVGRKVEYQTHHHDTDLNEAEHEDAHIINAVHTAKQRGGYLNCKLAVQMATGIPKVTELPKVKKHQPGDVLSWGPTHYAITLSNNHVVHVPEWGGEVETAHLDDLKDELGPPQAIHRPPPGVYRRPA